MNFSPDFIARFRARCQEAANGCLLWTGGTDYKGYGAVSFNCRMLKTHRVAFFLEHGRWPEPCALHGCDAPACVRVGPGHVFEGTPADNTNDMMAKGRHRVGVRWRGEANKAAKITPAIAREIRARISAGESTRSVGLAFGIGSAQVSNVNRGKHWGWVQ